MAMRFSHSPLRSLDLTYPRTITSLWIPSNINQSDHFWIKTPAYAEIFAYVFHDTTSLHQRIPIGCQEEAP